MPKPSQLLTGALLALMMASCATRSVDNPASWTADEAMIRSQMQDSVRAWNRGDLPSHLAIYDPKVTYITDNGPRPGVAAIEESFKKSHFGNGRPLQSLGFEQLSVRPLVSDTALVTGRYVLAGGGKPQQAGWFTLVWVRGAQGWRAVHDHSD